MTDELKHCETCDTPMLGRCEFCALKAENLSLRTHHTALLSALTRIAEGGVERGTNATVTRRMIAMAEIAQDTLESLKPPHLDTAPNPPHPAEKGKP